MCCGLPSGVILHVGANLATLLPPVACAIAVGLNYAESLSSALSPSLSRFSSVLQIGTVKRLEWQTPALIKQTEALVPLVSSFHNYPCNSFIIYLNEVARWPNIQWIGGLIWKKAIKILDTEGFFPSHLQSFGMIRVQT